MLTMRFRERKDYDPNLSPTSLVSIVPHTLNGDFESHTHDYCELIVVRKGKALHRVAGEETYLAAGDVYVLGEGVIHSFVGGDNLESYNIGYRSTLLSLLGEDVRGMAGYQALFLIAPASSKTGFRARCRLTPAKLALVESICQKMLSELSCRVAGNETLTNLLGTELIVQLARAYKFDAGSPMNAINPLARTVAFMEANWNNNLKVQVLAEKFGSSVRHFDRVFKEHYRMTPFDYYLRLRIHRAEEMLAHSTRTVTEVAFECGFSDSNYFSRQFKRLSGRRPSEVRGK